VSAPGGHARLEAYAKLTLSLRVTGVRADGYHLLQTLFRFIDFGDILHFTLRTDGAVLRLNEVGAVPAEQDLCVRAARLLQQATGCTLGVDIRLDKRIPLGGGLGGGSSNAAATLAGLCRLWDLDAPREALQRMAGRLGADVPFFLEGGTALASGVGDRVEPLPDLPATHLVVLFPGIAISTAGAYRSLNLKLTSAEGVRKIDGFCDGLARGIVGPEGIFNDFEASILAAYPVVREARNALIDRGATAVSLSGSGSSVFGFFRDEESALAASRTIARETWRVFPAKTLSRAEYFQKMFG